MGSSVCRELALKLFEKRLIAFQSHLENDLFSFVRPSYKTTQVVYHRGNCN